MAGKTIEAAGGIVMRKGAGKLIAVVQRSKDDAWVLPRGKLKRDENPSAAARREVVEETGHRVEVHEYLGAITYRAGGRPKVVQFWRMEAEPEPSHELMPDIVAVDWLPLKAAVRRLSYPLEKLFLRHAIARALKKRRKAARTRAASSGKKKSRLKTKPAKTAKTANKPSKKKVLKESGSKAAAKRHRKLKQRTKDATVAGKTKDKAKRRAKDKKKNSSERKSRRPKKPRKKKDEKAGTGRKPKRGHSDRAAPVRPASHMPVTDTNSAATNATTPNVVAALPVRTAAQSNTTTRKPGEGKTILQRVLGRLAG